MTHPPETDRWFGAVTADVALDPHIKTTSKAVYLVLVVYADRAGRCYPGIDTIARNLGAGRRTVQDALRDLEANGVLAVEPQFKDGRQISNLYRLLDFNALRGPGRDR